MSIVVCLFSIFCDGSLILSNIFTLFDHVLVTVSRGNQNILRYRRYLFLSLWPQVKCYG